MDEIFEQLIECDKGKGRVKILQGLAMILVVLSAFFLLSSLVIAIVMLLLAIGAFILSYLSYVEYEYELYNKTITVTKIYNESKRKIVANISMEDVRKVYESTNNTNNKNKVSSNNDSEIESDSDEEKALAIVKKDWGSTDGVYFKVQAIDANGNYVISVNNADTTQVMEWYTVNPKTGEFSN